MEAYAFWYFICLAVIALAGLSVAYDLYKLVIERDNVLVTSREPGSEDFWKAEKAIIFPGFVLLENVEARSGPVRWRSPFIIKIGQKLDLEPLEGGTIVDDVDDEE